MNSEGLVSDRWLRKDEIGQVGKFTQHDASFCEGFVLGLVGPSLCGA